MSNGLKKYNTICCCGIDCGLCPRFISQSDSACPGCGAPDFYEKHPSCGFLTCCAKNHGLEICSECNDFPCKRFDSEREGYDSFVTHKKVFENQEKIKSHGLDKFLIEQTQRIEILNYMIDNYDNGRSKSFFCQTCTLLPLDSLLEIRQDCDSIDDSLDIKERNQAIKGLIQKNTDKLNIDLKLRKK